MAGKETGKSFDNLMAYWRNEKVSSAPIDAKDYYVSPIRNPRDWEILGKYLGTEKVAEEIGRDYGGLARERVRQIVKAGTGKHHQAQISQIQAEHPIETFDYAKSRTIESRRRLSESHGGITIKIEQAILEGQTLQELKEEFTLGQIVNTRRRLRNWQSEAEIPYEKKPILPRFEKLKNPELSDEETQKLLDGIKHHGILRALLNVDEPLITGVSEVARAAGLHFNNSNVSLIYTFLKSRGIPGTVVHGGSAIRKERRHEFNYYAISATDKERAINAIRESRELDQFRVNPVRAMGKNTDEIPRAGQLIISGDYARLGRLIYEIAGKRSLGRKKIDGIIDENCPVSVYHYRDKWLYEKEDRDELLAYLKKRLKEVGYI